MCLLLPPQQTQQARSVVYINPPCSRQVSPHLHIYAKVQQITGLQQERVNKKKSLIGFYFVLFLVSLPGDVEEKVSGNCSPKIIQNRSAIDCLLLTVPGLKWILKLFPPPSKKKSLHASAIDVTALVQKYVCVRLCVCTEGQS